VPTLHGEVVGVAPARRAPGVPVRSQQLHAYVLPGEVIRGVVGDLPHELEAPRVGDELTAKVRAHPFGPVLDMNTLSRLRHRTLPRSMGLVWTTIGNSRAVSRLPKRSFSVPGQPLPPFDSFPTGITARARPTSTHAFVLRVPPVAPNTSSLKPCWVST